MTKPVLGFICCSRILNNNRSAQSVTEQYLLGIAPNVGATPLLIPSIPALVDIDETVKRIDGLMLTGSPSNINPKYYGDEGSDAFGPFDENRDDIAMHLCDAMLKAKKPIFGICRGFQELNVHFGGTIARDLSIEGRQLKHHAPDNVTYDEMFEHFHNVELFGFLADRLGKNNTNVNSVHFQGVAKLGAGLQILAKSPDGIIEAFYSDKKGAPIFAVQWHPEWDVNTNQDSREIFQIMGEILKNRIVT
jgi:putative glutamine amidotransferase